MSYFAEFDKTALEMVNLFGTTATYIKNTGGSYNPATGEYSLAQTTFPIKCIVMDLTLQSNGNTYRNGTMIEAGDKQVYIIPPEKINPTADVLIVNPSTDKILIGTKEWNIVTSKEYNPSQSDNVLIELYIRK